LATEFRYYEGRLIKDSSHLHVLKGQLAACSRVLISLGLDSDFSAKKFVRSILQMFCASVQGKRSEKQKLEARKKVNSLD
jgi:hypothetical protein